MTLETVYADAHLAGSFTNPNNAIGNTPTTWAGALNTSTSATSRWSLANPSKPLVSASTQTIIVSAKKGSNSGTPTIAINLYENGSLISTILSATNVTSTTGQTLTATFSASAISNPNDVEIEIVMTAAGGSPSARNSAQIAYIQWDADIDTSLKNASGGSGGALDVSGSGGGSKRISSGSSGALTVSGSGGGGVYKSAQGGSGGALSISGSGSGRKNASGGGSGSISIEGVGGGVGKSPLMFLTKNVKRGGVITKATVFKKTGGSLVQTGGQTR